MLFAPALQRHDVIGIVSPSSPEAGRNPRRLDRALRQLQALGFNPRLGAHVNAIDGYRAGSVDQRLNDLHTMFEDPSVRAIIATVGGHNANDLLDGLDYGLIAGNPKLFMGYSDITILHAAIHRRTGLVTMLGPALLPQFGEIGGINPFTWKAFERVLMRPQASGEQPASCTSISEFLLWDQDDERPRHIEQINGPVVIRPGHAAGPIVAGHLPTLLLAAGTPFWPELRGRILCVEFADTDRAAEVPRSFAHLRHVGALDEIAGLAVGRMHPTSGDWSAARLEIVLKEAVGSRRFPIAANLDFGHTDPMLILPWGVKATIQCDSKVRFSLDQAAVSEPGSPR